MQIQCERLKTCIVEMDRILNEYFEKTIAKEGIPKLDMDWDFYTAAETNDKFVVITAREEDKLIGFVSYYVGHHPHHRTTMFAACDILAVKLDHRGQGIATRLLQEAEKFLKLYYVQYITHSFRTVYDTEPLFPKLGYKLTERMYIKAI